MPELPEVETMVRGIRPAIEGCDIVALRKCRCPCKPISVAPSLRQMARRTVGTTITSVRRLAKRVVIELSSADVFVIEPRMTGLMLLGDPPDRGHLRVEWQLQDSLGSRSLWFWDRRGLGTLRLFAQDELKNQLGEHLLGPDALTMTSPLWIERCTKTARAIKVALLDQKFAPGIGNLYASEILHRSAIHPEQPANALKPRQVRRLATVTVEVLQEAIKYEGSTLSDGTYRNALNKDGQYQNAHRVYDRAGETCRTCGHNSIERIVQAQRSTFFCPACQRL